MGVVVCGSIIVLFMAFWCLLEDLGVIGGEE